MNGHRFHSPRILEASVDKDIDCGALRREHVGRQVTLAGWVHRRRDHGGLVFLDLRDRSGVVQVVVNPEQAPEAHAEADRARSEWVLQVVGDVGARPAGTENPRLPTGEVEVMAREGAGAEPVAHAALLHQRGGRAGRVPVAAAPLPVPAPPQHAGQPHAAPPHRQVHPGLPGRARLHRDRDAHPHQEHAGGGAGTTWCPAACTPASSTRCPSRRSRSSSC